MTTRFQDLTERVVASPPRVLTSPQHEISQAKHRKSLKSIIDAPVLMHSLDSEASLSNMASLPTSTIEAYALERRNWQDAAAVLCKPYVQHSG